MAYSRFFMPLLQEASGYEYKGKSSTGRCIVESRNNMGKVTLWAQDLKPEIKYTIFLIFAQNQKHIGFNIGTLNVDSRGKAEFRRDITSADIHTFTLDEVAIIAVTVQSKNGIISPLCGYKDMQIPWRHSFSEWKESTIVTKTNELHTLKEETPSNIQPPAALQTPAPPPPLATKPVILQPPQDSLPSVAESQVPIHQLLDSIVNSSAVIEPFKKETRETLWTKCSKIEQLCLVSNNPNLMNELFILNSWANHEHFILGITTDGSPKQYIVGLPGIYNSEDLHKVRQLGFTVFKCPEKDVPQAGDCGYWLMVSEF